jgi:hypothetical protein
MNSPRLTNILLLLVVLLLCLHVGLETFRPVGRYVKLPSVSGEAQILDTSSGTVFWENGHYGRIVDIVGDTKKLPEYKVHEPEVPTGEPPDETHRP